jgi:hypothetical protein
MVNLVITIPHIEMLIIFQSTLCFLLISLHYEMEFFCTRFVAPLIFLSIIAILNIKRYNNFIDEYNNEND